jgi:cysteine desulfurase
MLRPIQKLRRAFGTKDNVRIYLDYASVTPIDTRVEKVTLEVSRDFPANPSSIYKEGVLARKKLEEARSRIAKCLEALPDEIYFTSGGTESNNIAVQGLLERDFGFVPHIVSTVIEHPSIKEVLDTLVKKNKCTVTYVDVDESGIVDDREIKKALTMYTVLVSVMYANNEIGTIQPIRDIAKALRSFRKEHADSSVKNRRDLPYFHVDGCQAAAYETLRIPSLGIDMLTLDGSKIYGPRGTGVLYIRRGVKFEPVTFGGNQENGLRPGTENVANAVGFATALELCQIDQEKEVNRVKGLRNELLHRITASVPGVTINGDWEHRLPNNINICLAGMEAEFAVLKLDVKGISVSSVTSCRTMNEDSSSYVIEALGKGDCAKSSLRITLGRFTTEKDIKQAAKAITGVLTAML